MKLENIKSESNSSKFLTIPEVCDLAGCGTTFLYKIIGKGELHAVKMGRKTLVPKKSFDDWLENLQTYSRSVGARK